MTVNAANVLMGVCDVYVGTAGQVATTHVGYTQDGVEITQEKTLDDVQMDQSFRNIKKSLTSLKEVVKFNFGEATLANIGRAMQGASVVGNTLTLGSTQNADISIRIVGPDANTATGRIWDAPYVNSTGSFTFSYKKGGVQIIPVEFEVLERGGVAPMTIKDASTFGVTLSTDAFARVAGQGLHIMSGEGAAADALTDITGTDLANGERIVLQIANASMPITVTHAADTIELDGAANFVMTHPFDRLVLEYETGGSQWVEKGRYKHAA